MARRRNAPTAPDTAPEAPAGDSRPPAPAGCHVHWLDAACGILSSAADWLLDQVPGSEGGTRADGPIDLSGLEIVVPGRAAGHRLLEILVDRAGSLGRSLVPPRTVTLGALPERLYQPARPLADPFTETLCWVSALAAASRADRHLVAPGIDLPPSTDEAEPGSEPAAAAAPAAAPRGLLDAARMLVTMHRELAANALSFADLAESAEEALPAFADHARWEALARLERVYLTEIDGLGFWDRQTARRVAVERGEIDRDERLVLLATVDIDPLQRRMLAAVRGRIDVLVAVPPGLGADPQACFDDYGCIVPDAWLDRTIPVALDRVVVVDDAEGQAGAVVDWIGRIAARRSADEITVAVPDAALVPVLEEHLAARGLSARYAAGRTCVRSSPWQLAHAMFEWLSHREFRALADLLRCPDGAALVRRVTGIGEPTTLADAVAARHLPWRVDRDHLAGAGAGDKERAENATFLRVLDAVDAWLAPLRTAAAAIDDARPVEPERPRGRGPRATRRRAPADAAPRPRRVAAAAGVGEPAPPSLAPALVRAVRQVWGEAVAGLSIDRDDEATRVLARSLAAFGEVLAEAETVPDRLVAAAGSDAFARLLLDSWGRTALPPPSGPEAIDLVGWLEVALDDSPALAITGCTEGSLPGNAGRDPLLPEPLRQALGLDNASRTAARDAWMLAVAASREDLLVVVPRKRTDGSPAVPSRLLFRRDPAEVVVAARRWFAGRPATVAAAAPRVAPSRLVIPEPTTVASGAHPPMRVTEFRDYLACPYRYWLRHRMRLSAADDDVVELGAPAFGTLVHECLDRFAHDAELAGCTDGDRLADGLSAILDRLVAERYGTCAVPAVAVQAELARRRLREFARVQAHRTARGWRIHSTERSIESRAFVVDGEAVTLVGRVDRIDHHPGEGAWQVLDYKTSQRGRTPEQTHRDASGWIDLQLPLYRHLLAEVPGLPAVDGPEAGRVGVGYFNIPARIEEIRVEDAPWTGEDYASADEAAAAVVRQIREGVFWPPADDPGGFPEYDGICQTRAIRDDEEGEA